MLGAVAVSVRAGEGAEAADDVDPALIDEDGHGFTYGVASEPGFLHEGDFAGELGAGRVGAVIDTRPQVVRKLYVLGHVGAVESHK